MQTRQDKQHHTDSQAAADRGNKLSATPSITQLVGNRAQTLKLQHYASANGNFPKQLLAKAKLDSSDFQSIANTGKQQTTEPDKTPSGDQPVQRIVVNTGDVSLSTELAKREGWIIASDIQVALQEGGYGQKICELNALDGKIDPTENIYLVGHGSEGYLGDKEAEAVAPGLNSIIPDDYQGVIRSLNCSSGVGGVSAVEELAELTVQKTIVRGANGVALNHTAYEGGSRIIPEADWDTAEPIVEQHIEGVHAKWEKYIKETGIYPSLFKLDAVFADLISDTFYKKLETTLDDRGLLLSKDEDMTVKQQE